MKRSPAALAAVAAASAAGAWFAARSLQQDFAAYWIAGAARRLGVDPYLNHVADPGPGAHDRLWDGVAVFRHGRFLYPPLVADLFRPLAALPYLAAKSLFTAAMLGAWIVALRVVDDDRRRRAVGFVASALFFPLYRHLERGQIDLLILLLLALAWRARGRPLVAGMALAAAAAFKPTLAGLVAVVWAGGRGRAALAALGAGAALCALTALVDGPARLGEYIGGVLPRAALYGEGGTEEMLLPPEQFPGEDDDGSTTLGGRRYRTEIGAAPAIASVPRLLAPEEPSPASAQLPFIFAMVGLAGLARRLRRSDPSIQGLIFWATALACVITSPAGWVMGLVLALPLVPLGATLIAENRAPRTPAVVAAVAWVALALPQPFVGWAAVAGVALVGAAAATAVMARADTVAT